VRRTYRYNKETGEMEEVDPTPRIPHGLVESNFVSPIDGSIITSQRKLHEHNMKNNVTQVTPEVEHRWEENRKAREDFYTGDRRGAEKRREAIIAAVERHSK
jgi:hypothetical protein